jgi:hypothetical protein
MSKLQTRKNYIAALLPKKNAESFSTMPKSKNKTSGKKSNVKHNVRAMTAVTMVRDLKVIIL